MYIVYKQIHMHIEFMLIVNKLKQMILSFTAESKYNLHFNMFIFNLICTKQFSRF